MWVWCGEDRKGGIFRKDQFRQPTIGFTHHFSERVGTRNTPQYV